jgi:hypothetical protein
MNRPTCEVSDENMRDLLNLALLNHDIFLASPYHKHLINIDFTGNTLFPGIVADDGGWDVFFCELPTCKNGELLNRYKTTVKIVIAQSVRQTLRLSKRIQRR